MSPLRTLLDAPEQLLAAHHRLRTGAFPIISIINARTALEARVWLASWARSQQRVVLTAPETSAAAARALILARCGRASVAAPLLRLPGPVRAALPVAAELMDETPQLAVVLTCGIGDMVESLLDPAVPQRLVSLALQGLVPVDEAERRVLTQIATSRRLPLLRGPCEGILFYMLEARPETRGRFLPNQRLLGHQRRSHEVDIACADARLVVELDGPEHEHPRRRRMDADKQQDLEAAGFRVARFRNTTVMEDPVGVWRDITAMLSHATQGTGV